MSQHRNADFDQRIADWLEEDPNHAPRGVLDTVLAAYPSIPQRHALSVPWRYPTMFTNRLGMAAAIAVVLLVAIVGVNRLSTSIGQGGSSPTPAAGPTAEPTATTSSSQSGTASPSFVIHSGPTGFDQVQTSTVYRYAMRYPSSWSLDPGRRLSPPDSVTDVGLGFDDLYEDGVSSHLYITAWPLSISNPDLATVSAYIASNAPLSYGGYSGAACKQSTRTLVVDGEPATEADFTCPGHASLWVTTVHNRLVYEIGWLEDKPVAPGQLQPKLDGFLQSFTFLP